MGNNLEKMRSTWHKLTKGINCQGPKDIATEIICGNYRKTSLQHLALRYRRFSYLALVIFVYFAISLRHNELYTSTTWGIIAGIYACVLLLCSSIFDWWIYKGLSSVAVTEMPVAEVINKVWFYRKRHLQYVACVLPISLCWIGVLIKAASLNNNNEFLLYGIVTGAILGLLLGSRTLRSFMSEYKDIRNSQLESD